jgi:hypothetical protein
MIIESLYGIGKIKLLSYIDFLNKIRKKKIKNEKYFLKINKNN